MNEKMKAPPPPRGVFYVRFNALLCYTVGYIETATPEGME